MNKTLGYELTIIVPIYNEEDNIDRLEKGLSSYLNKSSVKSCILFVNDGSKDNSKALIEKICLQNDSFFYINFAENRGLSAAIKAGIDTAESTFVGYIDADLQTTPEDFELLLPYRHEFGLVMGIRTGRKDSLGKKLSSKIANGFRRWMTNDGVADTGCPLKIIKTDNAKRIPFFTGMHRFLPALIQLQNVKVKQIPVRHFERIAGTSKFNLWNRLIGPFLDCFAYRWMKKRYINYNIASNNIAIHQ
ncbi:glycosyltransferase family 2 protein [Dysgonomonas capnocytophagoides]|uniref:glycosyltransferase family 2 protein n=1 Tax=Dysgonomonas capnocytophagoides TaxID=45254 RepID=UPI003340C239